MTTELLAAARVAAARYSREHPAVAARWGDEIESDACYGAALAALRHDPAKATLATYATWRATGAILDGVRSRSPIGRREYQRDPDPGEVARRTPVSLDQLRDAGWNPQGTDDVGRAEDRQLIAHLLDGCTRVERWALIAGTMYGYTGTEIGRVLGVSEAAVSQARKRALARLREDVA